MEPLAAAARNNAILCDRLARAQGFAARFLPALWRAARGAPPLVPDAVTLPEAGAQAALGEIRALAADRPGALAVKDSAAALDLGPFGFAPFLEADWLMLPAASRAPRRPRLVRLRDARDLAAWERLWRQGESLPEDHVQFPAPLIARADLAVMARMSRDGRQVGGGVLLAAAGVVGISNAFSLGPPLERVLIELAGAARGLWPERPVVSFGGGALRVAATGAGYRRLGPLRLWRRPAPGDAGLPASG